MRRRRNAWLAAVGALLLLLWQAQVAQAATGSAAGADAGARHCAAGLAAAPSGAEKAATASAPVCFDSFAEAISFATDGRVSLPAQADRVDEKQLLDSGAASTQAAQVARPLLGVEYQNSSYGGGSLVLYGSSGTGCYSGEWYGFPSMASLGFDNRISSAKMYSNCLGKHHDGTSYTGSYTYCETNCSSLGSMNDKTSSIKFI